MTAVTLTKEEQEAAIEAARIKKKGTSTEHNEQILQLSPEMREALASGVTEAVKGMYAQEVEMRQKMFAENAEQARSFVGDAIDMAHMKKERAHKENVIIAKFLTGVKQRDRGMIEDAYADEEKFLKRKTMNTDKD